MSVDAGLNMAPAIGDHLVVLEDDSGSLVFSDFVRGSPLPWHFASYLLIDLAVARWRGLGAPIGLLLAFGIIIFFTVPSLVDGNSLLLVGLILGPGALLVLLYLAHGVSARTPTAHLGTIAASASSTT